MSCKYGAKKGGKREGKCFNKSSTPLTHETRGQQGDSMDIQSKSVLCATQSLAIEIRMRGSKPTLGKGGAWAMEGRRPGQHTVLRSLDEVWWRGLVRAGSETLTWGMGKWGNIGQEEIMLALLGGRSLRWWQAH